MQTPNPEAAPTEPFYDLMVDLDTYRQLQEIAALMDLGDDLEAVLAQVVAAYYTTRRNLAPDRVTFT